MTRSSPGSGADPASSGVEELISVIVPVFNESEVIAEFHRRTSDVLSRLPSLAYEIIYVDDGSSDGSHDQLMAFAANDHHVRVIKFSRNFGHQNAITAGLDFSRGDCVVLMDADLQDPPEVIVSMVEKWRDGYDVVYGQRTFREGETRVKLLTASLFYRVLQRVTNVDMPSDVGDFRLLSRRAVHQLKTMREKDRFVRGMVSWIGFRQTGVEYRRDVRLAGETKYPFGKMTRFALDGVTSFSTAPLRVATWFGYAASGLAFLYLLSVPVQFVLGITVPGFSTIMVALLFLGGTQLICIGILGEYIGRIFNEVKGRPLYIVEQVSGVGLGDSYGADDESLLESTRPGRRPASSETGRDDSA